MYDTRQFKKGLKIEIDGVPYQVIDFQHVSPGKGSAFTRTKLKNLLTQGALEKTFKSHEKIAKANTFQKKMQYLYKDSEGYHFMDISSYEQIALQEDLLGSKVGFLMENMVTQILFFNDNPIDVELPNSVELTVVETEPAFKGDTVSGGKPAVMNTGVTVTVPFHIKEGDKIKVDTRDSSYCEKVSK